MNNGQPANPSHGLLIALVSVSVLLSLGTMGLFIREQGRSTRAQQELIATLAALRTSSPVSPSVTNGQQPVVAPPVNQMRPVADSAPSEEASSTPTPGKKIIYTESRFSLEVPTYCPVIAEKQSNRIRVGSSTNLDWASFTIISKAEYDRQMIAYANTPDAPGGSLQLKDKSYLVKSDPQDFLSELQPLTQSHPQAQIECVPDAVIVR